MNQQEIVSAFRNAADKIEQSKLGNCILSPHCDVIFIRDEKQLVELANLDDEGEPIVFYEEESSWMRIRISDIPFLIFFRIEGLDSLKAIRTFLSKHPDGNSLSVQDDPEAHFRPVLASPSQPEHALVCG